MAEQKQSTDMTPNAMRCLVNRVKDTAEARKITDAFEGFRQKTHWASLWGREILARTEALREKKPKARMPKERELIWTALEGA